MAFPAEGIFCSVPILELGTNIQFEDSQPSGCKSQKHSERVFIQTRMKTCTLLQYTEIGTQVHNKARFKKRSVMWDNNLQLCFFSSK